MTFIPNAIIKDDPNNSRSSTFNNFTGISSDTTGYASLIVSITINSADISPNQYGKLQIYYSPDGSTFTVFFTDTILFTSSIYRKTYPLIDKYYYIAYDHSNTSLFTYVLNSRLSTEAYLCAPPNSSNSFVNAEENLYDAFGKLRVSPPFTLLDLRVPGQDQSGLGNTGATNYLQNFLQMTTGGTGSAGATGYKTASASRTNIYVSGNFTFSNQSRKYCTYQPGKSFLIKCSGVMDAGLQLNGAYNSSATKSRIGYFDDYNGLYFEYTGNGSGLGTCSINVLNAGGVSSTSQSNWNIDIMDGSGISGLKLDWVTAQLFVIDFEWLGVGRIRFGFYAYGRIQYCHEITNINMLSAAPFTTNINLPIRYQFIGRTGGTGAMIQICSTILSEGGYEPIGRPFSFSATDISAPGSTSTELFILYIRGGNNSGNYYHQQIIPSAVTVASTGSTDAFIFRIRLYLPETIVSDGLSWADVQSNLSVVQGATSGTLTTSTTGIIVSTETGSGRGSTSFNDLSLVFTDLFQITSDVSNKSAILGLSVQGSFTGSSKIYATINWNEIY